MCHDATVDGGKCGSNANGEEEMLELDTGSNEEITEVSGYSNDANGWTDSFASTTTAGRSWGPHGDHKLYEGYQSLRNSPGGKLRLRFLSGDQTHANWIFR